MSYVEAQLEATYERVTSAAGAMESIDREVRWLEDCAERERALVSTTYPSAWPRTRLALSPTEERALWVLVAHELNPRARVALRELATEAETDISLDVLRKVVYGSRPSPLGFRELGPAGTLRKQLVIERLDGSARVPDHRMTFRASRRVLGLVHDCFDIDDELEGIAEIGTPASKPLVIPSGIRERTAAALARPSGMTILCGSTGSGRRSLLLELGAQLGLRFFAVDARKLSTERGLAERQLRLVARDALVLEMVPLILNLDALTTSGEVGERLDLLETCCGGRFAGTTTRPLARRWQRPPITIDVPRLGGIERARMWQQSLPEASDADAELLSNMYPLAPALIEAVGRVALVESSGAAMQPEHVEVGLRSVLDDRLAGLATRVTVSQRWEDLVLPEEQSLSMIELLARIRQRRRVYEDWGFANKLGKGLGVAALFTGPPGTGKTMCAGLIARDLGTELYQVDLGKIVSKWIGETEKNLGALFDAAESGHAVLLFDEADALFGKRTTVHSSNDRHANQETNYLLQRLETFNGICILTTNHETAIDDAFRRRLAVYVRFSLPDIEERERLWRALLPRQAQADADIAFDTLARKFVMSGGHIRNAILRAAFFAADANQAIRNDHLALAAQLEYESIGKLSAAS